MLKKQDKVRSANFCSCVVCSEERPGECEEDYVAKVNS